MDNTFRQKVADQLLTIMNQGYEEYDLQIAEVFVTMLEELKKLQGEHL